MTAPAQHTPGPWEQLSHKYLSIDNGQTPQVFEQATEADERLMLAAPDLLLALRGVEWGGRQGVEGEVESCPACGGLNPSDKEAQFYVNRGDTTGHAVGCALVAAVAKAEGGAA